MRQKNVYVELLKFGILFHSLLTFSVGYLVSTIFFPIDDWKRYVASLIGFFLISGAAAALNHALEVHEDAQMKRTKNRPLPSKRMTKRAVYAYATILTLLGSLILFFFVNPLLCFLCLLTLCLYDFVYTPLKKMSWLNTFVGAVPGAMPPVCGWVAVSGQLDFSLVSLFLIFFFWQLPHFFSICWLYKEEYKKAGFKMITALPNGKKKLVFSMLLSTVILILVSLMPFFEGYLSLFYLLGVLLIGIFFLYKVVLFAREQNEVLAKGVLKASILYQPLLLTIIVLDVLI